MFVCHTTALDEGHGSPGLERMISKELPTYVILDVEDRQGAMSVWF
jgi:hypothetical protein